MQGKGLKCFQKHTEYTTGTHTMKNGVGITPQHIFTVNANHTLCRRLLKYVRWPGLANEQNKGQTRSYKWSLPA
jgi:hypothetical protein